MHPARFGDKSHGRPDFWRQKNNNNNLNKNESFFPLNFIVYNGERARARNK